MNDSLNVPEVLAFDVPEGGVGLESAVSFLAPKLETGGFVTKTWANAILEREAHFPTGLPLENPVAIPHAGAEHTLRDAFVIARFPNPVTFGEMDSPSHHVSTRLAVFILAGANTTQVDALKSLIDQLVEGETAKRLLAGTPCEAAEHLKRALN